MGRTRRFSEPEVIDQVMHLFWEQGYEETSLGDIEAATGVKRGSLYLAFGDKSALFGKAVERYWSLGGARWDVESDPRSFFRDLFRRLVEEGVDPTRSRRGCLVMNSCVELAGRNDSSSRVVESRIRLVEKLFKDGVEVGKRQGVFQSEVSAKLLAYRLLAAAFSLREMAKFRPEREFLEEIAEAALEPLGMSVSERKEK